MWPCIRLPFPNGHSKGRRAALDNDRLMEFTMTPLKEIGEFLIAVGDKEYFFRPSFINMTRIGEPKDIAKAVAFLSSDDAAYITGTTLHVNGGLYMS